VIGAARTAAPGRPARVFLVDDHPVVRLGLTQMLTAQPDLAICGEAASGDEALERIPECRPDLVVIDISLGGQSGLDLIEQLRRRLPEVKMLVSSMHGEELYAERALAAGAQGYVQKSKAVDHIVDAVRRVLGGGVYLSRRMTDRLLRTFARPHAEPAGDPTERLSNRELEVFALLGDGASTRKIAERLHISIKTVETHRERIKEKLGLEDANQLIRRAVIWSLERR
jgi:DNA-binding NarL/FixJ family response regulator